MASKETGMLLLCDEIPAVYSFYLPSGFWYCAFFSLGYWISYCQTFSVLVNLVQTSCCVVRPVADHIWSSCSASACSSVYFKSLALETSSGGLSSSPACLGVFMSKMVDYYSHVWTGIREIGGLFSDTHLKDKWGQDLTEN